MAGVADDGCGIESVFDELNFAVLESGSHLHGPFQHTHKDRPRIVRQGRGAVCIESGEVDFLALPRPHRSCPSSPLADPAELHR